MSELQCREHRRDQSDPTVWGRKRLKQDMSTERRNELTCLYVNARSLVTGNKFHTLEAWVHDLDPNIIGITE